MANFKKEYRINNDTLTILFACLAVVGLAWIDTSQWHAFTAPINRWILLTFYASPGSSGLELVYYEALQGVTALGGILFVFMTGFILLDLVQQKKFIPFCYCVLAVILIGGLTQILKHWIDSPRPLALLEADSFPSGHVTRAAIWCGLILFLNHLKVYRLSQYWCRVLWLVPILVAFTRLALGRHWIDDVIASYALSVLIFYLLGYMYLMHETKRAKR